MKPTPPSIKALRDRGCDRRRVTEADDSAERARRVAEKADEVERLGVLQSRMDRAHVGQVNKAVRCVDQHLVFPSLTAAAAWYGVNPAHLSTAIRTGNPVKRHLFEVFVRRRIQ